LQLHTRPATSDADTLREQLFAAATCGDVDAVRRLLAGGQVSANVAEPASGNSVLMQAAGEGHAAVVDALLQAGARPDQADAEGWTARMLATENGHITVVQALLQAGAAVNQARSNGENALMFAAENGYLATVQALLQAGAGVGQPKSNGATALTFAAQNGHTAIAASLSKEKSSKSLSS
jgi:ankyrin repeat protein